MPKEFKDLMKEIENLNLKVMKVDNLRRKISVLEKDLQTLKNEKWLMNLLRKMSNVQNVIKCSALLMTSGDMKNQSMIGHQLIVICVINFFSKNSDLERHLEIEHDIEKIFQCDDCGMNFMLKWRLKKHMSIHNNVHSNIRFCHYFNNCKSCPFETINMKMHLHASLVKNVLKKILKSMLAIFMKQNL